MTSKKRKASELQDDPNLNGHDTHTKPPISSLKSAQHNPLPRVTDKSTSTKSTTNKTSGDPVPFYIQCPAKAGTTQADEKRDVFRARDDPGLPELSIEYTIKPGRKWGGIRAYRNVKLMEQTFTIGQIIYVNRKTPAPTPPSENAPDADIIAYDKANLWVGRIAQAKAESDKAVFLRVFWLYWPEELPMGRQPYHGDRELIMSNAMDIVDAQTIACAAEVSHWDEDDDESDGLQKERFWRQTFDINKLGTKSTGGLSSLRKHCICQAAYNPDRTMYKCQRSGCELWNHEECLSNDILRSSYEQLQRGELEQELDRRVLATQAGSEPEQRSLNERLFSPAEKLGQMVKKRVMNSIEAAVEEVHHESALELHASRSAPTLVNDKKKASRKKSSQTSHNTNSSADKPWAGKLSATITISDVEKGLGAVLATITLLDGEKAKPKQGSRSWTFKLDCLKCGKQLE